MERRILVYTTQLMPTGGIESHLKEFCMQLSRAGASIDLVVLDTLITPQTEKSLKESCSMLFTANYGKSFMRIFWLVRVALKLRRKKYACMYTNGQGSSIDLFVSLIGRKAKWVHHHHTSGDIEDQRTWGTKYRNVLQNADEVIACSRKNSADMKKALDREIVVLPCFSSRITVKDNSRGEERGTKIRMGYFGRLIPEKGIDIICRLSEEPQFNDVEFHLWGEGQQYPDSFFDQYPAVYYHGAFHSKQELIGVVQMLDAFLLLSVHPEGLPISLLEVMSAGVPWLATDRGGIPDIACDAKSTRVISYKSSYDEIKLALLAFANDIKQGKVSRERQRKLYDENFSSETLVVKWSEKLEIAV